MNRADRDAPDDAWQGPNAFDDFVVVRPLGHGGMGQVYLGRDVVLDRPVALKFTTQRDPSAPTRARFLREARAIARLSHPNVVGIFRIGEVEGRPYIAYEFVAGRTLADLRAPMPWSRVARIGLGMARGLAAAHAAGVLHRDIKPSNVMVTDAGEVKLLDFGLARLDDGGAGEVSESTPPEGTIDPTALTVPGDLRASTAQVRLSAADAVMGTPLYIPPEIWLRDKASERSDLYALGLVLYELLTGRLPHAGRARELRVDDVLHRDAEPVRAVFPDVLPSFAAVVDQCVRRAPAARPASAMEVAESLERICTLFVQRPEAARSLREDTDAEALAASMNRCLTAGDRLVTRVYERLFAARPEARAMFPDTMNGQREKLQHALRLAVESLADLPRVEPLLRDLGQRHAYLRLEARDYDVLGECLLGALGEVDPAWSSELAGAWARAYTFVVVAMRRGEANESRDHTQTGSQSGDPHAPRISSSATGTRPPPSRYAYVGEVGVAWQTFGTRAPDLLLHLGWISHLDHLWRHPRPVSFLRGLGNVARVIAFDKRGVGLSERVSDLPRLEESLRDPLAVLDMAGARRAVVFGVGDGATTALLLAAVFPERVRGVVCLDAMAKLLRADDYPEGLDPSFVTRATDLFRQHWGDARFAQQEAPSLAADPDFCAWYGEYLRSASSPGMALAQVRLSASYDARVFLPFVRVPALVMSHADNAVIPSAAGRHLARHLADARYVSLPGADNLPYAGDTNALLTALQGFLRDPRLDAPPPSPLTTLALVRADRPDAPRLALAAERFAALGAQAIALPDPRTALYATPWFTGAVDVATQLAASDDAVATGVRVALHAEALELARLQGTTAMESLRAATEALPAGSVGASSLIAALNAGTPFRFDPADELAGLGFLRVRRAER